MNTRNALILSFALVLCCVILRGSEGQDFRPKSQRQPVAGEIGRYQVAQSAEHNFVVIDTTTGQVWENSGDRWYDRKSPVEGRNRRSATAPDPLRREALEREAQDEVEKAKQDAKEALEDIKRDAAEAVEDAKRDAAK